MNLPIFVKSFKDMWREKTFVLVLALIFFVIISLSLLIAVTAFIYNPEFLVADTVVVGYVGVAVPQSDVEKLSWRLYDTEDEALAAFDNSSVDAVIIPRVQDVDYYDVILPSNPVKNSLLSGLLREHFEYEENRALQESDLDVLTPLDVQSQSQPIKGMDNIFEILFGFALPLFLLIPTFLIGNLFVDMITEEFERKNTSLLFSSFNPLRYVHELLLFGLVINVFLVLLLQAVMYLRFPFLVQPWTVFLFVLLFFGVIVQLAILLSFVFQMKTPAQLSYSFAVLSLFLFSPYVVWLPIKAISLVMLGISAWSWVYVLWVVGVNIVLYVLIRRTISKNFYV